MTMAKILNISGTEIKDNGIRKLAGYVESNLPDDFTLVIGCKPSIYDVDAVLIGMGNIYAIECKDWKGNIKGSTYGWWQKDGQVIENPLQQARNNAVALGKWLRDNIRTTRNGIWVKGLVVFTHGDIGINLNIDDTSNASVSLMHLHGIKDHIDNQEGTMKKDIENIVLSFFCKLGNSDEIKNMSWLEKLLAGLSICLLITTIILGYQFFFINRDIGFLFVLSGLMFVITTIYLTFSKDKLIQSTFDNKDETQTDDYDPRYDLVGDPLNIYDTYSKP